MATFTKCKVHNHIIDMVKEIEGLEYVVTTTYISGKIDIVVFGDEDKINELIKKVYG